MILMIIRELTEYHHEAGKHDQDSTSTECSDVRLLTRRTYVPTPTVLTCAHKSIIQIQTVAMVTWGLLLTLVDVHT